MSSFSMPDSSQLESQPQEATGESFHSGALDRIRRFMLIIASLATAIVGWKFGVRCAIGFVFGSVVAFINFYWLKRAISGFADRATQATTSQPGSGIVARFLLRYVLIAIAAYAILTVSPASLDGLLAGLFLPVGAIFFETGYEVYVALTRRI
jgi:small-conductance mechanosensitive channel